MPIKLMKPHENQLKILQSKARFKILNMGRRFGKTSYGKIRVGEVMLKDKEQAFWIAPNYPMALEVWEDLKDTFGDVITWKNEQQKMFEVQGGGSLRVFSGEKYENIRGTKPFYVVVDEAATIPKLENMWNAVIRPALSDKKGYCDFLSTPKGRNFFYELYKLGLENNFDYQSFCLPSWKNPYYPKSEIIAAKETTPLKLFQQEYLAQFLLDAGEVFLGVTKVAINDFEFPYEGHFVFGIDLARKNDFTVVTVFDIPQRKMVDMIKINQLSWDEIKTAIRMLYDKWKPTCLLIEENNGGEHVIDDLKKYGLPARSFNTNKKSKGQIIETLALDIQNQKVTLLNNRDLISEFQAFQMKQTETGIKYGAPIGYHDDIVMATAIGYHYVANMSGLTVMRMPIIKGWRKYG